jgi:hypothetical protein
MIFSTARALVIESNDKAFLEAGIHENVAFVGVRSQKSSNGNLFIEFEFNKNGDKLTHTEWEPNKLPTQSNEEFATKVDNQVARIMQIMSVWYTKDQLSYEADSFEAFATWVNALMNSVDKSMLVRLKAVYGQNGYTSLPKYAKYTFIESMEVSKEKSKIKELKIDEFVRPHIGDKEIAAKSSAEVFISPVVTPPAENNLPF